MTRAAGLLCFLPQEALPLMVIAGGFLLLFGLRRLALGLFTLCGMLVVLPPVLEALLNELPAWALYPILLVALVNMAVFFLVLLIGPKAWTEAKGIMTANALTWCFLLPFRLLGRLLFRRR